jgi:hypothetical protein
MRSGKQVEMAAQRNRDLQLQTTSSFSNLKSVQRSTACFRHKNVLKNNDSLEGAQKSSEVFFFNLGHHGRVPSKHAIKLGLKTLKRLEKL